MLALSFCILKILPVISHSHTNHQEQRCFCAKLNQNRNLNVYIFEIAPWQTDDLNDLGTPWFESTNNSLAVRNLITESPCMYTTFQLKSRSPPPQRKHLGYCIGPGCTHRTLSGSFFFFFAIWNKNNIDHFLFNYWFPFFPFYIDEVSFLESINANVTSECHQIC